KKKKKKKKKKKGGVVVFKRSSYQIERIKVLLFYGILGIVAVITCGLGFWVGLTSTCAYEIRAIDFDPMEGKTYYNCLVRRIPFLLLAASGAVVTFCLNSVVAFMYVSRMIKIVRKVHEGLEHKQGDQQAQLRLQLQQPHRTQLEAPTPTADTTVPTHPVTVSQDNTDIELQSTSEAIGSSDAVISNTNNTGNTEVRSSAMFVPRRSTRDIVHVRKATFIAVTSIASTMLSLLIIAINKEGTFIVQIDTLLNGLLIYSVFSFGNHIYLALFHFCGARPSLKHSAGSRSVTTPTGSKSGSGGAE
ncbi:hypothetical protein RFI_01653, partial [Reticulomyxa filosa]